MISFDINRFEIEIRKHTLVRAAQRGLTPEIVWATVKSGKIKRFGKCNLRFIKQYKNFQVICVDEVCGNRVTIVTVVIK